MKTIHARHLLIVAMTCALALAACGKQPAPTAAPSTPAATPATPPPATAPAPATTVVSVTLGNAVGADGKIAAPTVTFGPKDTIYAVVATNSTGGGSATISARWTFGEGQAVSTGEEKIAASGPATTTFHVSKPDGWPVGRYSVEISVDGKAANTTAFEVK